MESPIQGGLSQDDLNGIGVLKNEEGPQDGVARRDRFPGLAEQRRIRSAQKGEAYLLGVHARAQRDLTMEMHTLLDGCYRVDILHGRIGFQEPIESHLIEPGKRKIGGRITTRPGREAMIDQFL